MATIDDIMKRVESLLSTDKNARTVAHQELSGPETKDLVMAMDLSRLSDLSRQLIPHDKLPGDTFLTYIGASLHAEVYRALLAVFFLSHGKVIPREFQLEAVAGAISGRDGLITAATGSGKTLILVMLALLRSNDRFILIVPLKRLQTSQTAEFDMYGVTSMIINEDTPDDPEIWQKVESGETSVYITTMEQLGTHNGHMSRFGRLLRSHDRKIVYNIKIIFLDEAQTIVTAGMPRYNQPAFRPAYGKFDAYRLLFPKRTTVLGCSATLPPHILRQVKKKIAIRPNHFHIIRSSNRRNIMYATLEIVGSLSDFRNLNFIIPPASKCTSPTDIPPTIVFHDSTTSCDEAARFQENLLPPAMRGSGIIRHYHSLMTRDYLDATYEAFQAGSCRILHTCSGMESGINFKRADIVIQYGIASDETKTIQRGGRAGRNIAHKSLFIIMYEKWVKEIDISSVSPEEFQDDPDRPISMPTSKNQTKAQRTGIQSIKTIQSRDCIREIWAKYLGDHTAEALIFTTQFCCDRHNNGFNLQDFVPGPIFTNNDDVKVPAEKKRRAVYRPIKDRGPLEDLIYTWRRDIHKDHPLRMVMPKRWIIDNSQIKTLAATQPSAVHSPGSITDILGKPSEWTTEYAHSLFNIIHNYNTMIKSPPIRKRCSPSLSGAENEQGSTRSRLVIKLPSRPALIEKNLNTSGSLVETDV